VSAQIIESPALATVQGELRAAMTAKKCHRCGCFQGTVRA